MISSFFCINQNICSFDEHFLDRQEVLLSSRLQQRLDLPSPSLCGILLPSVRSLLQSKAPLRVRASGAETIQPGEAADGKQEAPKWSTCCLLWAVDQTLTPETPWKPSPLTKSRSWTKDKQSTPLGGNRERAGRNQTRTKLSRTDPTISLKNESKLRTTAKVCAFTNIFSLSAQWEYSQCSKDNSRDYLTEDRSSGAQAEPNKQENPDKNAKKCIKNLRITVNNANKC